MKRRSERGKSGKSSEGLLERFSHAATRGSGSSLAFAIALGAVLLWAITGPLFRFSDSWQLVINTSTTIVTFLMVFLIQRAQNKDSQAVHLKLNELVAALSGASNHLIAAESFTEKDLEILRQHYETLAKLTAREGPITSSHSVEEAARRDERKARERKRSGGRG